jgi:hypothetical protein
LDPRVKLNLKETIFEENIFLNGNLMIPTSIIKNGLKVEEEEVLFLITLHDSKTGCGHHLS